MISKLLPSVTVAGLVAVEATAVPSSHHAAIAKSLLANADALLTRREELHRVLSTVREQQQQQEEEEHHLDAATGRWSPAFLQHSTNAEDLVGRNLNHRTGQHHVRRQLTGESGKQASCDAAFIKCIPEAECVSCFATLESRSIDWTGVSPNTECTDVVKFLTDGDHCTELKGDATAQAVFCETFDACVIWNDDSSPVDDDGFSPDEGWVNCTALTECSWDGMHKNWIGDGICHSNMHGCYNTAICGYDGGDCCEDTCKVTTKSRYVECGHDGWACMDPKSTWCDSSLTTGCPNSGRPDDDPSSVQCLDDTAKYRLVMYDSFGDGWDTTLLTIQAEGEKANVVYKGRLMDGYQGTEYICLSKTSQCYNVKTEGGTWGVEVSWEIRPMGEGAPAIAGGGAPSDCDFSVAGGACPKTCDGTKPKVHPDDDPEYNSFKDLYNCIEKQCLIQLGACNEDPSCKDCFAEDAPDYCFGVDTFVAVVDCTVCSCTDKAESDFCDQKEGPGAVTPPPPDADNSKPKDCTPKETMAGASAIMDFSKCSDLDEVGILITDFDQNNFGMLDSFETCAHSFRDDDNHGGHTALGCMQILKNAVTNPIVDNKNAPVEAISALARNLYDHGESFCECTRTASDACPLCPSFMSFKTILYESLDACQSLDAIDCAAWNEFSKPCQDNLQGMFGTSDLSTKDQCDYVKKDCGGAGTFPAFRRFDCEGEIPDAAWTFYKNYAKKCLRGDDGNPPTNPPAPVPAPTNGPKPTSGGNDAKPSAPPAPRPTPKPYNPSGGGGKPYTPPDDSGDSGQPAKKRSHWFRNLIIVAALAGLAYYIYKKRFDGFNFVQYRRHVFGSRFGGGGFEYGMVSSNGFGESEMYSNLNSSTTFEPPSLPPTPQMMGGPSMMGSIGQFMGGQQMT